MRHAVTAVLFGLAFALAAGAQPITIGETVKIQSKVLGEERTILVSTPANYVPGSERYPVLYLTDGGANLTHTRGTVDFLAGNGLMPDMIIVGILNTNRTRDLTPTLWAPTGPDGRPLRPPVGGGAAAFLEFFAKELFPFVEGHYRTAPYRVFAGHSLGGLFALDALVTRPEMFNAVIAASPALNWDGDLILGATSEFFKGRKELPATLFVTMADEERDDVAPTRFERLRGTLAGARAGGFTWDSLSMPEETHGTVVLRTHYWGLRRVFDGWQLPADPRTHVFAGTLGDVKAHYAKLSKRMGYTIVPAEATTNQLGYQALGRGDGEGALAFFRYNVELYPGSANVYDSLGEALGRAGLTEESLANYEKAVTRARANGDRLLETFVANRDRAVAAAKAAVPKA